MLWDIDHTLLYAGGLGRDVYRVAFATLTGRQLEHMPAIVGHTDRDLVAQVLAAHRIEVTEAVVGRFYEEIETASYLLRARMLAGGRALPGAREAVAALAALPGVVQSVATGNLPATARLKLRLFGFAEHLDLQVGGYGSDSSAREALIRLARSRASARYQVALPDDRVLVIGDTTADVAAALAAGARAIGVASGPVSAVDLDAAGADLVLADLVDTAALVAFVRSLAPDAVP